MNANQVGRWLREHGYGGRVRKALASVMPAPAAFVAVSVSASAADWRYARSGAKRSAAVQSRMPSHLLQFLLLGKEVRKRSSNA